MNPRLNDYRVRGGAQRYLKHVMTGKEYDVDKHQAKVLWLCDGIHQRDEIARMCGISLFELDDFLTDAVANNIIAIDGKTQTHPPLGHEPYLKEVHFDASGYCNLFGSCLHCFGVEMFKQAAKNQLTTDEALHLFDQMEEMNVAGAVLSGGEIFMRKDLPILIRALRQRNIMLSSLFTNGTIWRDDVWEAMEETQFRNNWLVSLDGHTTELNDYFRGQGSFEKTVIFMDKLVQKGHKVAINTVLMKQNLPFMLEMMSLFKSLGVERWRCSIPREQGAALKNRSLIMADWKEVFTAYELSIKWLLENWRKGMMKVQIGSVFRTDFILEPNYYLFSKDHACCEYKRNHLTVKPDGMVTHCTAFDDFSLGNIREEPLSVIWKKRKTQALKTLPIKATKCVSCEWFGYCGGGCRKTAWNSDHSFFGKDETVCPLYEFVGKTIVPLMETYGIHAKPMTVSRPPFKDYSLLKKV